mgnify:CR=1 FL=1
MAKKIKGITIEIGGDVQPLNKALEDVNKKSRNLQSELRQVERLLKLDPGNTELVAQKQKILAEAVENSREKLNRLRAAQEQVNEQFKRGDINEEQYRAFQREIIKAEQELRRFETRLQNTIQEQQKLAESTRRLETFFKATGTSVDKFADVLGTDLTNAIKKGTANSKQLDDALDKIGKAALGADVDLDRLKKALASVDDGNSIVNVRKELDSLGKEAKTATKEVEGLGVELENVAGALVAGGGIAGVVEQAFDIASLDTTIEITFEVPESSKAAVKDAIRTIEAYGVEGQEALEGVRRQWALNADASDEANARIVKGAAAITKAYAGIDFVELIQEINEISRELNITNEEALGLVNSLLKIGFPPEQLDIIAEYGQQLQRAGYEAEEIQAIFAAGIETGTWNIDNLLDGLKEGRIRLAEFGQEVPKATQELLANTQISTQQLQAWGRAVAEGGAAGRQAMQEVAQALMSVKDETTRNALGVQIFGTMWEDQGENIIQTILGMNKHLTTAGENQNKLNQAVSQIDSDPAVKMSQAINDIKTALEPLLNVIADVISKIAEWAQNNPKLAATIIAVATAIGIIIGACTALSPILIAISTAAGAMGVSIGAIAGSVGIAIAAIAGLTAGGIALYNHLSKEAIPEVQRFGDEVSESTQKAVGAFLDLNDQATVALNQLSWSGQTVTQEMANNITSIFDQMGDQVLTAMQEDHAQQLQSMQEFFAQSSSLTEQEEAAALEKMKKHQQEQQQVITDGQKRIAEILQKAADEKRALTEKEKQEINRIQQEMVNTGIQVLSESELEQKAILERMKANAATLSAQQAAEVVRNSKKQKDEAIKAAEEQYNEVVKEIIRQRDEVGSISKEQADKLIQEATRQRDEAIKKAEEMHQKVIEEAKKQAEEHVDKVNWETGEVLTKWETFKNSLTRKWDEIKTKAASVWESTKKAITKPIEEAKETILDIIEKIKSAFANMKITIPKPKLPHIKVKTKRETVGDVRLIYPDFDVEWYAKGGIFTRPSIIGVGEAGKEAVIPLDKLPGLISDALKKAFPAGATTGVTGGNIIVQQMIVRNDNDIKEIAKEFYRLQQQAARRRGLASI